MEEYALSHDRKNSALQALQECAQCTHTSRHTLLHTYLCRDVRTSNTQEIRVNFDHGGLYAMDFFSHQESVMAVFCSFLKIIFTPVVAHIFDMF